jgi:hypothetical protein
MHKAILLAVAGAAGVRIALIQYTTRATLQLHDVSKLLCTYQQTLQV